LIGLGAVAFIYHDWQRAIIFDAGVQLVSARAFSKFVVQWTHLFSARTRSMLES
jgi:hypothetical protein